MHSELVLLSGINVIIHKMQFRTRLVDSAQSLASIPCPAPSRSVMNWLEIWPWPPLISTSLHRYACKPTTWLVCGRKHLHTAVNVVDAFDRLIFLSCHLTPSAPLSHQQITNYSFTASSDAAAYLIIEQTALADCRFVFPVWRSSSFSHAMDFCVEWTSEGNFTNSCLL